MSKNKYKNDDNLIEIKSKSIHSPCDEQIEVLDEVSNTNCPDSDLSGTVATDSQTDTIASIDSDDIKDDIALLEDDDTTDDEATPRPLPTTLDDVEAGDDLLEENTQTDTERIQEIMENYAAEKIPCGLNKKRDEKLKNLMTYITIPFVLISIAFSLFNIGSIRYPYSFVTLALGLATMTIFYTMRNYYMKKDCKCPVCEAHYKTNLQFAIMWGVGSLGLLGTFIFLAVTNTPVA